MGHAIGLLRFLRLGRSAVNLEVVCPTRVSVGDPLDVEVTINCSRPVEVALAQLRWMCRYTLHTRAPVRGAGFTLSGWSEVRREQRELEMFAGNLPLLAGTRQPGQPVHVERQVTVQTAPPSAVMPEWGAVLHYLEVHVRLADGSDLKQRQQIWVRPARPSIGLPPIPNPGPSVVIGSDSGHGSLYGELYRSIAGYLVLTGGPSGAVAGRAQVVAVCAAKWTVHDLVPTRPGDGSHTEWREQRNADKSSQRRYRLGSVPTPPLSPGATVQIPFTFAAPKGTKQSTQSPSASIEWSIDTRWEAGDLRADSRTPITMSMPVEERRAGRRPPTWWSRLLRRSQPTSVGN